MRAPRALLLTLIAAAAICTAQTPPAKHSPATHPKAAAKPLSALPEIIFFDGVIYTGEGFAEDKPRTVEAMAIGGGKVLAVGTTAEVTRLAGPKTILRDLDTATNHTFIYPGFNDAHTHLGGAG